MARLPFTGETWRQRSKQTWLRNAAKPGLQRAFDKWGDEMRRPAENALKVVWFQLMVDTFDNSHPELGENEILAVIQTNAPYVRPTKSFNRFMELPLEIREMVYSYHLHQWDSVNLLSFVNKDRSLATASEFFWNRKDLTDRRDQTAAGDPREALIGLCLTSPRIFREAAPVFFRRNKFVPSVPNGADYSIVLRRLGDIGRSNIRHLKLSFSRQPGGIVPGSWLQIFNGVVALPQLRHLKLELNYFRPAELAIFWQRFEVRRLRGLEDVIIKGYMVSATHPYLVTGFGDFTGEDVEEVKRLWKRPRV